MEEVSVIGQGVYPSASMQANRARCRSAAQLTADSLLIESQLFVLGGLREA
jgi:hypothetical protein